MSNKARAGFSWVLAVAFGVATLACTPAVAVGVGAALVGTAALAARCSDAVHVTVVDAVTGLRACDAKVIATSAQGSEETFSSCFYASLPAALWTVRAERQGYRTATTLLQVNKQQTCEPAVQTIELSLFPVGVPPAPGVPIRPLRPNEAPFAPGALPPPNSIGVESAAPVPGAASAPGSFPADPPAAPPPSATQPSVPASPAASSTPGQPPIPGQPGAPSGNGGAPAAPPPTPSPPPVPH